MAVSKEVRSNQGSAKVITIDGIQFKEFGSSGFGLNDFEIIGDELDNFELTGESGHDKIEGLAGNDTLVGGEGNDMLEGDDGNDDLDGQLGTDLLNGGLGDDILRAGDGHDVLTGGEGNDTFGFYSIGNYHINDFNIQEDRFFFDAEKIGVNNVTDLVSAITSVVPTDTGGVAGVNVIFGGGIASIELVGISNLDSITADMVVFSLS